MQLARILSGNYPYRTYIPVYDATTLTAGEMVMRHASWAAANKYYITAYTGANTEAEDSIGILLMSSTDGYASKENALLYNLASAAPSREESAGGNFLEAVVNPDATYFAFYDQTDAASCSTAITASTTWTITSLEDNIDGGWLFTTNQADANATYVGLIRYLTASASGSCTVDSAVTVDTSTDYVKVLPIGHRITALNAEATGLTTTAAAGSGIYLDVRENFITHDASPRREARYWLQKGLDGLKGLKVEAELVQLRHCYRAVVA